MTKLAGFEYTNYIADNLCSKGIPLFKGKNVQNGKIVYEFEAYIPESVSDSLERSQVTKKCLLTPYVGTIGNIGIHSRVGKYHLGSNVGKIEILNPTDATRILLEEYVHYYLLSQYGYAELTKFKKATAQESISIDAIREVFIPIPPSQEQIKIVEKIEQIIPLADRYAESQRKLDTLNSSINLELKKSILQEAIQGKLVPQDPNDEPASALLERIREEKQRLLKEGKLRKKDITDSIIFKGEDNKYYERLGNKENQIDEFIPFDIPDKWVWTRLSTIANLYTGNSISDTEKKQKYTNVRGLEYIGTKDVGFDHLVNYDNGVAIPQQYIKDFKIAPAQSVLLCIEGGSAGRKIARLQKDVCFGNKLCCLSPYTASLTEYIYYYLQSPAFFETFQGNIAGIIGGVSVNTLKSLLIPLPPIEEINRITIRLQEVLSSIMRG